jgi:hypothetical protein
MKLKQRAMKGEGYMKDKLWLSRSTLMLHRSSFMFIFQSFVVAANGLELS